MSQGLAYNVDLVLCIDATGSMTPIIDEVKANALKLHGDIVENLAAKDKQIAELRVAVVPFRDVRHDGAAALSISPFFTLPDQESALADFVGGLSASGGGDAAESGLHAVATAVHAPWTSGGDKRRHIIVLWTDAPTHDLSDGSYPAGLQAGTPSTFDELTDEWEAEQGSLQLESNARRLILFAPDDPSWNQISDSWEQTVHVASQAGKGLADVDYATIIDTIGNSV